MTTYRELLERCAPYIDGRVTAFSHETDREALNRTRSELLRDIDAFLAQPMTTLTGEEQKWADVTMDNTKAWLVPSLRAAAGRVAESRAREGELVAALEAQKAAHEYRFGPDGEEAETAEEMNAFMYKAQALDEIAWQLTRAALAQGKKE
jgi:hypothetical protein